MLSLTTAIGPCSQTYAQGIKNLKEVSTTEPSELVCAMAGNGQLEESAVGRS